MPALETLIFRGNPSVNASLEPHRNPNIHLRQPTMALETLTPYRSPNSPWCSQKIPKLLVEPHKSPNFLIKRPSTVNAHCSLVSSSCFGSINAQKFAKDAGFSSARLIRGGLILLNQRLIAARRQGIVAAASHEESDHSKIDVEKQSKSEEKWKQTLESIKQEAIKMQGISKEAYEAYMQKTKVVLKDTAEQLMIKAEKASRDLALMSEETRAESSEYFLKALKDVPEPLKDVVETYSSHPVTEMKKISDARDFYFGIPYGAFLFLGGFLSFMISGSIPAIRFGVILGGALLALSILSLRAWNRKESSSLFLKGQSAIALLIFLREIRLLCQSPSFLTFIMSLVSGSMVAFYLYRIYLHSQEKGSSPTKPGPTIESPK
ncbi:protein FATTY ACID EXPORT 3, chloroplastic [Amborella trichopoda]|uniref:Protein FATTY ACID EXPORT 3, chloroplastic n=1 Tax=Amborella trichopoda TaxID=13333 RepID=W1PAZ7_AMBTC|nr:protein FATTY ACID EXPORT 3, chloroplastic [Amborella trichopoda]XP_011622664.1 protein FATTY ACID EXPORT 3, chloroplastic [Amborella trichopoda]ERN04170.1 hypothetical protein AMTR_s00077p00094250 [Amborella trichopoda]|eukprot:XP_006842495.1 protein FATTY ACID EXPORT 3, chloroplastic [Amborella trichopoda]